MDVEAATDALVVGVVRRPRVITLLKSAGQLLARLRQMVTTINAALALEGAGQQLVHEVLKMIS